MAELLSFAASVTAIASLAGNIVIKGSAYLQAVKSCRDDVRRLLAEVNLLRGVLQNLELLISNPQNTDRHNVRSTGLRDIPPQEIDDGEVTWDSDISCDDEGIAKKHGVEDTLNKFCGSATSRSLSSSKESDNSRSWLRRTDRRDLRWPWDQSKTLQLVGTLERYKVTCCLALTGEGIAGIHGVLEQTKISNKLLADMKAKQEHFHEMFLTMNEGQYFRPQKKALDWLSPVNPALKLQAFRRERQFGTGTWLFDLPAMESWLEKPDSALWIYGIPGAGKTLLSTLVVDEVLNRKRYESIGTAYFYIRHDDVESQRPFNVIGSLVAQLARQNALALAKVKELYSQHTNPKYLPTTPEMDELLEVFFALCGTFASVYIMIDGLDECEPTLSSDRKRLVESVAAFQGSGPSPIRILVLSREEDDIKKELGSAKFDMVSIAAKSMDIRLFVNAWLPSLKVRSDILKVQIADTLVDEAKGMFMWVRAQIDYLQRLPTDQKKQEALKTLPPDLQQTYIRIFETIDSTYPVQTTQYIQRCLRWLMFATRDGYSRRRCPFDKAICIGATTKWSALDLDGPTIEDIRSWLGCLIGEDAMFFTFSHFTVREFLRMDPKDTAVVASTARKYLVGQDNEKFVTNALLKYLLHPDLATIECATSSEVLSFITCNFMYDYAASLLERGLLSLVDDGADSEGGQLIRTFFAMPTCQAFKLWNNWRAERKEYLGMHEDRVIKWFESQLRVAVRLSLKNQVRLLLEHGMEPDQEDSTSMTPLHQAIFQGPKPEEFIVSDSEGMVCLAMFMFWQPNVRPPAPISPLEMCSEPETQFAIIQHLVDFGADVNRPFVLRTKFHTPNHAEDDAVTTVLTPLTLAIAILNQDAAILLLKAGAKCYTQADSNSEQARDFCSVSTLLLHEPLYENIVQMIVEHSGHEGLKRDLPQKDKGKVRQKIFELGC
ncbi:MAG: hypothetical protein Q9222_005369 [Ikaeria aurantiellina]